MASISGFGRFVKALKNEAPMTGKLIGTSKSGVEVYEKTGSGGARLLTSYKDGKIYKEITKEATVATNDSSSYINTLVKNYGKDEYTTTTKYFDASGNATSIHSYTKPWNGKDDAKSLNTSFKRYISQFFKDKKVTSFDKMENGRYSEAVGCGDNYTTTHKSGKITFPNGQVHDYSYEKFEPNGSDYTGPKAYFKQYGTHGIEVTDKGVNTIPLWPDSNYSKGPHYFRTH